jgi:hypothetical protein
LEQSGDLDSLAFEFFREFARCEYCLKAAGLRENTRDAKANWSAFAAEVEEIFDTPASHELRRAIEYLVNHPPKKQIIHGGLLEWDERLPDYKSKAELVLRLVCRIRNNLFHGGKFNGHWFMPQRSEELMVHGLIVLKACVQNHQQVREAYAQRAV